MITLAQISPFDYCNNKCFYCPVRYYKQPPEYITHMPPALFEKVISSIVAEKGKLVSDKFDFIYTGHYNEIVLYKYLEEMLATLRKYQIKTIVLSNGVAMTADKIDTLKNYKDVVVGINFNIPSFGSDWKEMSGGQGTVEELILNVQNTFKEFGQAVSVGMNSVNQEDVKLKVAYAKTLLPGLNIYPVVGLCDRAGLLVDHGLSNVAGINNNKAGKTRVAKCNNGNRIENWIHVNALGKAFLCCDDYFFKYEFGDFNKQSLAEIWQSEKHKEVLASALSELCPKCAFAVWE